MKRARTALKVLLLTALAVGVPSAVQLRAQVQEQPLGGRGQEAAGIFPLVQAGVSEHPDLRLQCDHACSADG